MRPNRPPLSPSDFIIIASGGHYNGTQLMPDPDEFDLDDFNIEPIGEDEDDDD